MQDKKKQAFQGNINNSFRILESLLTPNIAKSSDLRSRYQTQNLIIMKAIGIIVLASILSVALFGSDNVNTSSEATESIATAKILWETVEKDLGKVSWNAPITVEFSFTNSGEAPLLITSVKPSCGCTSSSYEKKPIKPGESSIITATYNASAKGVFKKSILVKSNTTKRRDILKIKGTVD